MKIPNYDTKNLEENKKKYYDFIDEDYRMLVCGASKTGKTNLLMHWLQKPLVYYDKIYIYTPNQHQDKIKNLEKIMANVSRKVGYGVIEIKSGNDIMDTKSYPTNNRKIVIFDDLVNSEKNIQNKMANHFTDGRHKNISPIYLSQSYYDIPQKIRQNCSHMVLYPPTTKNHMTLITKENLIEPKLFDQLKPFEFLFLDKEKKLVRKNFDEVI